MYNLKNRNFLDLLDFTPKEVKYLLDLARDLKIAKYTHTEKQALKGKNVALIFEKSSTRTRCAFEISCYDQGAHVTYLGPSGSHIGKEETIKDTARVLGRMFDGIEYRGFGQEIVENIAKYSGVPVFNGLTGPSHPTQGLADALTIREHTNKHFNDVVLAYVGDAHMNTGNTNLQIGALCGMDTRIVAPKSLWPDPTVIARCKEVAKETGARITITDDVASGVKDADFISGDIWVSMGESAENWKARIDLLMPYQINSKLMGMTGKPNTKFMHCLPSFHNTDTIVGAEVGKKFGLTNGLEVTEDVFESSNSIVFDEAENRVHTIKAVLVATLA